MMKSVKKAIIAALCAGTLVVGSVAGTMAYLTSTDKVVNTFTVGNVQIKLDEAKVDTNGKALTGNAAERVKANSYKLMPGHEYDKDPMVTVLEGSESSYIKMTVTFSNATELDEIFAPGADMTSIFKGYDSTNWIYKGNVKDTENKTRTYEFWYKEAVAAPNLSANTNEDVPLDALFDKIAVPGSINNEQLAKLADMTITVNAYAIQADGFDNAEAAWAAYSAN